MDPLLEISLRANECAKAEKKLNAAKRALGLLNRLNALQRANRSQTQMTTERISAVFARMNTLRAEVLRAKIAYHQAIEAVNLATIGQPANVRPRQPGFSLPGLAMATALMTRINGSGSPRHSIGLAG